MKYTIIPFLVLIYSYLPSQDHYKYGMVNPDAAPEMSDWEPLIGTCTCQSVQRNSDGTWQDTTQLIWEWKYIMEGMAVQDITLKEDGSHTTSIRQFNPDSSQWYVTFFSAKGVAAAPPTWAGGKVSEDIILYKTQTAPNGMEGFYKITFSEISNDGFNWLGEWVDTKESISYPTWKIYCRKTQDGG